MFAEKVGLAGVLADEPAQRAAAQGVVEPNSGPRIQEGRTVQNQQHVMLLASTAAKDARLAGIRQVCWRGRDPRNGGPNWPCATMRHTAGLRLGRGPKVCITSVRKRAHC